MNSVRSTAGVGEGAVLSRPVVLHGVRADEFVADRDLDGVTDDGDLDLSTSELGADAVAGGGEAHVVLAAAKLTTATAAAATSKPSTITNWPE
jgi:hypothetical protein